MSTFKVIRATDNHLLGFASKNAFDTGNTVGYINKAGAPNAKEGDIIEIPDGWKITQKTDEEGKVLSTKEGIPLSFFAW